MKHDNSALRASLRRLILHVVIVCDREFQQAREFTDSHLPVGRLPMIAKMPCSSLLPFR